MEAGRSVSDRSTASPRKTCVPGVHASAGVGINAMMASAIATEQAIAIARERQPVGPRLTLYAETFALPSDCLAQIAKLGFNNVSNLLARGIERVAELLADGVNRDALPQLAAAPRGPFRAAPPTLVRPSRCAQCGTAGGACNGRKRPTAARAATQHQRSAGANHGAEHRRSQQIVLLVTIGPQSTAVGLAVARAIRSRSRRSRHVSPRSRRTRRLRPGPACPRSRRSRPDHEAS